MTNTADRSRQLGSSVDKVLRDRRRLAIATACLGLAATCIYFVRPETYHPYTAYSHRGTGTVIVLVTSIAWAPYLVGWLAARAFLPGLGHATVTFIVLATAITIGAASLYLNLFGMREPPSPIMVSVGVAFALYAAARLCVFIWRLE
jgi:hypothetical protein